MTLILSLLCLGRRCKDPTWQISLSFAALWSMCFVHKFVVGMSEFSVVIFQIYSCLWMMRNMTCATTADQHLLMIFPWFDRLQACCLCRTVCLLSGKHILTSQGPAVHPLLTYHFSSLDRWDILLNLQSSWDCQQLPWSGCYVILKQKCRPFKMIPLI